MGKVFVAFLLTAIVLIHLPTVCAYQDSMNVIMLIGNPGDDNYYEIGDTTPVEVLVFDKGVLTDADEIPRVRINWGYPNEREVTMAKIGTGRYSGDFTILESDEGQYSGIDIIAEAAIGEDEEDDYGGITLIKEEYLEVNLEFVDFSVPYIKASPGDTVEMIMTVEYNGTRMNPDGFELTANKEPSGEEERLTYTNLSAGVFSTSYVISPTLSDSLTVSIQAMAEHGGERSADYGGISVNFYSIWNHRVNVNDTVAQFEVCVADMRGKAISGADINLDYEIDSEETGSLTGTTDANGITFFSIDYLSASYIHIEGTAEFLEKTQLFEGSVDINGEEADPEVEEPWPESSFHVIYQENAGNIEPGKTVTLEYIAYKEGEPLPDQPIYYYIYSEWEFIKSGSVTTNSEGEFTVTFTIPNPAGEIVLEFETPQEKKHIWEDTDSDDGYVYRVYRDYKYPQSPVFTDPDDSVEIETSTFKIGGNTTITARIPDSENYTGFAIILLGEYSPPDFQSMIDSEWMPLSPPSQSFLFFNLLVPEGDKFTSDYLLPEFLPKNETYTVLVMFAYNMNFEESGNYRWNYVHVNPGESVGDGDEEDVDHEEDEENILLQSPFKIGDFGIPWIAIIIIIVLIVLAILVGIGRRFSRAKSKAPQPREPAGIQSSQPPSQPVPPQHPQPSELRRGETQERRYPPPPPPSS